MESFIFLFGIRPSAKHYKRMRKQENQLRKILGNSPPIEGIRELGDNAFMFLS